MNRTRLPAVSGRWFDPQIPEAQAELCETIVKWKLTMYGIRERVPHVRFEPTRALDVFHHAFRQPWQPTGQHHRSGVLTRHVHRHHQHQRKI
jgi:hypothetical protein